MMSAPLALTSIPLLCLCPCFSLAGSTSGIGKEFADYLCKLRMNVLVVSRTEDKLKEQCAELMDKYKGKDADAGGGGAKGGVEVRYLVYDFTDPGEARDRYYERLRDECTLMVRVVVVVVG